MTELALRVVASLICRIHVTSLSMFNQPLNTVSVSGFVLLEQAGTNLIQAGHKAIEKHRLFVVSAQTLKNKPHKSHDIKVTLV